MKPSPEADKATLLRRVTYDLTGLPPTPADIDAFLADQSPDAYEKRVDALLQSPRYGERMAVPWLDAARYADTHGYHIDSHRGMWPWRDWVISAFNRNLPFDQFTIEQLAGDLLPECDARPEGGFGLQPQPHDQLRRRRDRRRVSGRIRRRSRRGDVDGVHGLDDGLRALPLAQVRSRSATRSSTSSSRSSTTCPSSASTASAETPLPMLLLATPAQQKMLDDLDAAIAERKTALDDEHRRPGAARVGEVARGEVRATQRRPQSR